MCWEIVKSLYRDWYCWVWDCDWYCWVWVCDWDCWVCHCNQFPAVTRLMMIHIWVFKQTNYVSSCRSVLFYWLHVQPASTVTVGLLSAIPINSVAFLSRVVGTLILAGG